MQGNENGSERLQERTDGPRKAVRKWWLNCYFPLKLHSPALFLRMNIGNAEMLTENATPTL